MGRVQKPDIAAHRVHRFASTQCRGQKQRGGSEILSKATFPRAGHQRCVAGSVDATLSSWEMAMGRLSGDGVGLQQESGKSTMPPARFNQEMHAHALACSLDQLMMPPLAAQLCSAQISESRAEASAMNARQPRLESRDAPAASCVPCLEPTPTRHWWVLASDVVEAVPRRDTGTETGPH